ncbi:MAG: hypothetical protein HOL51_17110 [Gemmatimonadetes bacterium]|nr:hypothetical protein [Gemmatimonadota bacterium]
MTLRKKNSGGPLVYLLGFTGVLCMGIAVAGLLGVFAPSGKAPVAKVEAVDEPVVVETIPIVESVAAEQKAVANTSSADKVVDTYYPLEVGRYWVYVSEDAERGTRTEVERRIVRRESRADQELFYFSDGTVAFREDDKIFEMGSEGGVNVIPTGAEPYVYRSEGLHIEKQIGNLDTVMILGQQRYSHCVQVVTRFRPVDQPEQEMRAYASYYARGIGLVGRELWPPSPGSAPTQTLRDYGPRKM